MLYKDKNYPKFGELPVRPYDRVLEILVVFILIVSYVLYFTKENWLPADIVIDKEMKTGVMIMLIMETFVALLLGFSAYSLVLINVPVVIYEEASFVQYTMISRMVRELNVLVSLLLLAIGGGILYGNERVIICHTIGITAIIILFIAVKSVIITRKGKAIAEMSK